MKSFAHFESASFMHFLVFWIDRKDARIIDDKVNDLIIPFFNLLSLL